VLERPYEDLWFDYFGLNHLGWLRAVRDGGEDRLPELLAEDTLLESFEEGALFGGDWLRTVRMIPNEYLLYYYFNSDTVEAIRRHRETRAKFLLDQQAAFYEGNGEGSRDALRSWRDTRHARERSYMAEGRRAVGGDEVPPERPGVNVGGYEGVAMGTIEAIALNTRATLILTVANRSSLPFLDETAVVEVPCVVGSSGAEPIAIGDVPGHAKGLMQTVKDIERTTIEAALTGSEELAIKAIALHPVVPSVATARRIFRTYVDRQPALAGRFQ
jgi:6-phospho-beta-glucosidase